jgi:membrane-bound metal-dependent hydrolase YbcI (DUF457 family)
LLAVALGGFVLGLDLAWSLFGGSAGSLWFGLVDEPAHLATTGLALLALAAIAGQRPAACFACAALAASVAIDLDHLPGYLGWDVLAGGAGRPYPHGLLTVAVLLGSGLAARGRYRLVLLGFAFGLIAHLLRDSATGPGVALLWPLEGRAVAMPYAAYVGALVAMLLAVAIPARSLSGRRGPIPTKLSTGTARAAVVAVALAVAGASLAALAAPAPSDAAKVEHRKKRPAKVAMGVYVPDFEEDPGLLGTYSNAVGRPPAILHLYRTWSELPFEPGPLDSVRAAGAIPLVTWEPWGEFEGTGVPLAEIAAGGRDGYIAEAARQAAAWGWPLFARFAHEMNGSWYPWGAWVNGNTPAIYKAAWRRIVAIFRAEGATNVKWVWTPYVHLPRLPFKPYYPGDKWVDWAGFDGFNWGNPFISFRTIFDKSYWEMVRMTSKPLMIAETGSVEVGGNKADWLRRALRRTLPSYRHVRAVVWFSDVHPNGADWRIDSSPGALHAFGETLRARQYVQSPRFLLRRPEWLRAKR